MHECKRTKMERFSIVGAFEKANEPPRWYGLYDKQTHTYVWKIFYCPFCGEKLC